MSGVEEQTSLEEIVGIASVDNDFFSRHFFPRTVRQPSPPFHDKAWGLLESDNRLINIQFFRGAGKTSLLRMYAAKRVAYGLAHTILYIGKSEGHALRSVRWLRRQIEFNKRYSQTFGLRPGAKWQDSECEIWHGVDEYPITITAAGITGSIRGLNQDDYRPDLIIIDDVIDEENSATLEQRQKIENLIYGALKESLAPASEAPDAKMVMLQTPLNGEDASTKALNDPEWVSAKFSCWTPETDDAPLERQESSWPERWSSETLRKEKRAAIARNQLSIWLREKECKITSPESSAFRAEWLEYYELEPETFDQVVLVIDPVPPPSENQLAKGLQKKDYEALSVVGKYRGRYYLLEYSLNRGHEPDWTIAEFFRLGLKWRPRQVIVESVAYQRTLAWLLRKAMQHQRQYFTIHEIDDKRKKHDVIVDGLNPIASNRALFIKREHTEFLSQFTAYPNVAHDDLIETVARACSALSTYGFGLDEESEDMTMSAMLRQEENYDQLPVRRGCP